MKLRLVFAVFITVLLSSPLIPLFPGKAQALSGSDFKAGYIIDDTVFFNGSAMDTGTVQAFLNAKVPVCDTWHAGSGSNQPPFTCLKDYRQDTTNKPAEAGLCNGHTAGNKSAAQIIFEVGQSCGVSQKALLVLLQKEQSLVTDTWPWNIQYRSATGFGCPDTAPCDAEYYGFFNQVYAAARQFKRYARDSQLFNFQAGVVSNIRFNPNAACGSSPVLIQNPATAALYNYTPYQPNAAALNNLYGSGDGCSAYGNRNFWRMFIDWFGTTMPAGEWLRQGSDGQVWLVVEGLMPDGSYARKKFRLSSWETYLAYFLQYEPVVKVTDEYLSQYTDDGVLGTRAIGRSYAQIQFINNGYRYFIPDSATCDRWGFDCYNTNYTKVIPGTKFLERLTGTAQAVPPVMAYANTVYKLEAGKKMPILDGQTFSDLGYSWNNILYDAQSINAAQPLGPLQISHQVAIQFTGPSGVMLYNPASFQFHKVANYEVFQAWGMQQYAFLNPPASSFTTTPPTPSSPDLSVWAQNGTGQKFLVDQGRKIDVTNSADMPAVSYFTKANGLLANLPTTLYGAYATTRTNGAVYFLENGQKRYVPNWENFVGLGVTMQQLLPISSYSAAQFSDGALKLADGATFEVGSGVWMVNGNEKLHVPQYEYFTYFKLDPTKRITGQANLETAYSGTSALSVFVRDGSGNKYLMQNGSRLYIDAAAESNWGLGSVTFQQLSDRNLARLPVVGTLGRFVYLDSSGLYYASGGQKHHIESYASYQNLGGNLSNTFTVAPEFFSSTPTGSPIP